MRYAIPMAAGELCMHFGHCEEFALIDTDNGKIVATKKVVPPPHAPGVLPAWLAEQGANVIIAGGMGMRAQSLFRQNGITVLVGAPAGSPESLVKQHLAGELENGENICDH